MLQRVQSIYLLCASLAIFALFVFPIAHNVYIGSTINTIKVDGIYQEAGDQLVKQTPFLALTIVCIVFAILPLAIIFVYKNRTQQIAFCYGNILALFGFSFWMSQTVQQAINGVTLQMENYSFGALLSSVSIFFILMAIRLIKKDEQLVKSADRLR